MLWMAQRKGHVNIEGDANLHVCKAAYCWRQITMCIYCED